MSASVQGAAALDDINPETVPLPASRTDTPETTTSTAAVTGFENGNNDNNASVEHAPRGPDFDSTAVKTDVADNPTDAQYAAGEADVDSIAKKVDAVIDDPTSGVPAEIKHNVTNEEAVCQVEHPAQGEENVDVASKLESLSNGDSESPAAVSHSASDNSGTAEHAAPASMNHVDRFDAKNKGDVVKYFFTSDTRHHSLSPVQEEGMINLQFHRDSDLFVKTRDSKGRTYIFEVVSAWIATISPIFFRMVYETHTRGNQEEWIWNLNDNPVGLKLVFCFAHHMLPEHLRTQQPSAQQLYDVLTVMQKYKVGDCVFQPYAKDWMQAFRSDMPFSSLRPLQAVYVAYKLGDMESLKIQIRRVAHEVEVAEDGTLRLDTGERLQDVAPVNGKIAKTIELIRSTDLETIIKPLRQALDYLMDDTKTDQTKYCKSVDHHDECNEKLLGALLSNLLRQRLYPLPAPREFPGTVHSLAKKIADLKIRGLYLPGLEPHKQRHGLCKLIHDEVAERVLNNKVYLPLSDNMVQYMVLAAKQAGTYKDQRPEFQDYKDLVNDFSILCKKEYRSHLWGWDDRESVTDEDTPFSDADSGVVDDSIYIERKV